jgi:hypothetical protein
MARHSQRKIHVEERPHRLQRPAAAGAPATSDIAAGHTLREALAAFARARIDPAQDFSPLNVEAEKLTPAG